MITVPGFLFNAKFAAKSSFVSKDVGGDALLSDAFEALSSRVFWNQTETCVEFSNFTEALFIDVGLVDRKQKTSEPAEAEAERSGISQLRQRLASCAAHWKAQPARCVVR